MKIAIIEDKTNRLEKCTNFELAAYQSVKIITGGGFDHFLNSLEQRDTNSLAEFDCIAAHRSAMSNEIRDTVKDYCKTNNKPLVFFSGGITASVLKDNEFPFLLINSKDFYSKNLKLFIEACEKQEAVNLLVLQFGENWKLSLLLNLRNRIAEELNKHAIKEKYPAIEFSGEELIKRVSYLKINTAIKPDLENEKTASIFSGGEYASISLEQILSLKSVFDQKINEIA